jgi:alkylhydroperoxidase family enzyme
MTVVNNPVVRPLAEDEAAPQLRGVYETLTGKWGSMPNLFAVMAHRPAALTHFLALYESVMAPQPTAADDSPGGGDALVLRDKELVYLKTALLNGCEY